MSTDLDRSYFQAETQECYRLMPSKWSLLEQPAVTFRDNRSITKRAFPALVTIKGTHISIVKPAPFSLSSIRKKQMLPKSLSEKRFDAKKCVSRFHGLSLIQQQKEKRKASSSR